MDFDYSAEEQAFRAEIQAFLKEHLPRGVNKRDPEFMKTWLDKVRAKRWVGFSWPREYGGGGGSIMQQVILKEEMTRHNAPPLGTCMMGLQWVGPGIIRYGTEEQKRRFLPDILDSKYQWCTGYSEPGCGSDLASLQCKGEREGDVYVVNGQKIWTTMGAIAEWMILLVRTSTNPQSKHDGITCLLVHMKSPGIEVRPIKTMAGPAMFAEVFFNDVRVPVDQRLGDEGKGWEVTLSALANERSGISEINSLVQRLNKVKELARETPRHGRAASEDPYIRRRIARCDTIIESMRLNGLRYLTKQLRGEPLSSETSVNKLHRATLEVEFGELALEIESLSSVYVKGSPEAVQDGYWQFVSLVWPETVIGGGTPNIQKNIIAERILGLPKD
jgi:alkylation response protein AidB-like acyl-CoA dehydrogenase